MAEISSGPAAALSAQAAAMGARLADLLDEMRKAGADPPSGADAFLREMSALHGAPRPGEGHPLARLATALRLSALERDLVVLAGLPDEHHGYASVLRSLHPTGLSRPTAGLAASLLCAGEDDRHKLRAVLAGGGSLVRSGLLRVGADGPHSERSLELPGDLWAELAGSVVALPRAIDDVAVVAGLHDWLATPPVARAVAALAADEPCTVLVVADGRRAATARGLALVKAAGREALAATLPAGHDATQAATLHALHAIARGAVPVLAIPARDGAEGATLPSHPGPRVVCGRAGDASCDPSDTLLRVQAEPPAAGARRSMWAGLLPELSGASVELAARHAMEPSLAARVAADARTRAALDGRATAVADVAAAARARSSGALPAGVSVRRPTAGWSRLVLQPDRLAQLHAAVNRLRHQSTVLDDWGFLRERPGARGVRMLLSGPPGTGKTLSAEVLAHALGVDLMVVDISQVLSKWIGETEQHLAEIFDAAEPGQAVLLFDEADALFGKRTEVSDARDRYANLETAYLLQRLERFEGLAILTTNLRRNIDEAFIRRIEFVVELDVPSADQREALWRAHMPDAAPVGADLDLAELAGRYPVVGGLIRNAAVAAAFSAAGNGGAITREHVLLALQREYEKHGRAFPGRPPDPTRFTEEHR